MITLTLGHPALLQELCGKMVDIANKEGKRDMSPADVESVVNELVTDRDNSTLSVFWGQFCVDNGCKEAIRQILHQQVITHKNQCYQLEEHQFIIETDKGWQFRVPLFEQWLRRFSERDF
jgi:hypothetical protein